MFAERLTEKTIREIIESPAVLREYMRKNNIQSTDNIEIFFESNKRKFNTSSVSPDIENIKKLKQARLDQFFMKSPKKCSIPFNEHVITKDLNYSDVESNSVDSNDKSRLEKEENISENSNSDVEESEYVVESIVRINYENKNFEPIFNVKWLGFPESGNTWEPLENLKDCDKLLTYLEIKENLYIESMTEIKGKIDLSLDQKRFKKTLENLRHFDHLKFRANLILLVAMLQEPYRFKSEIKIVQRRIKPQLYLGVFKDKRDLQMKKMNKFLKEINGIETKCIIQIENIYDFESPNENFTYINESIGGKDVIIPNDPPIGCSCDRGCSNNSNCCSEQSDSTFAYDDNGCVIVPRGTPIYECNKRCLCDNSCRNRISQVGCNHTLILFKTSNGCGWGVRTKYPINKGSYISEYVGEIINNDYAELRGKQYDARGRTYLFDLDFNDTDNRYTIDAAHYGNISRFINHSCEPNCALWAVWDNCLDPNLPKIVFFAIKKIKAGEELNLDYLNQYNDSSKRSKKKRKDNNKTNTKTKYNFICKCGASNCRNYIF